MTDQSLTRYTGPRTLDELARYGALLAGGNGAPINTTLPAAFRGNPAAVAFAVEYAKALDVAPITALTGIHLVDGKPTASAGLISALIRRAGHRLRVSTSGSYEAGDLEAVASVVRADDPDHVYEVRWNLARAARAGLVARTEAGGYVAAKPGSAWAHYPEGMLKARAITEVGRDAAEDVLLGVHYTAEELGELNVDEAGGVPLEAAAHDSTHDSAADIVDAVIVEDGPTVGAPQSPPAEAPATTTPATPAPAATPQPPPPPPASSPAAVAEKALDYANAALICHDVETLRELWADGKRDDLLEEDVAAALVEDELTRLHAPPASLPAGDVRLGALIQALGKYVKTARGNPFRDVSGAG